MEVSYPPSDWLPSVNQNITTPVTSAGNANKLITIPWAGNTQLSPHWRKLSSATLPQQRFHNLWPKPLLSDQQIHNFVFFKSQPQYNFRTLYTKTSNSAICSNSQSGVVPIKHIRFSPCVANWPFPFKRIGAYSDQGGSLQRKQKQARPLNKVAFLKLCQPDTALE